MDTVTARYEMTADVFTQTDTQNPSGALKRVWNYATPISNIACQAQGILRATGKMTGSAEEWREEYLEIDWIRVATQFVMDRTMRFGHIKNLAGVSLFPQNYIYYVVGVTPVTDPFGYLVEYEVLGKRVREV